MGRCKLLMASLIVPALALGTAAHASTTPGAGSFLKHNVSSLQGLVSQIQTDKVVASRYAQVFKVSKPALVSYLRDNVRLSSLRRPTVTLDYYVNRSGKVVKGKRLLPSGTPVFIANSGEVLLDGRCGNPLRASLPVPPRHVASRPKPVVAKVQPKLESFKNQPGPQVAQAQPKQPDPVVEKVLGNPPTVIETLPLATAPVVATQAVAPTVVAAVPAPAVEAVATTPTAALPPVVTSSGGSGFLPWIAGLGGLGAIVGLGHGGGHTTDVPVTPPQPVPEPSSIVVLVTGMAGLAGYSFRRGIRR